MSNIYGINRGAFGSFMNNDDLVTLDTAQTITGEKTFTTNILCDAIVSTPEVDTDIIVVNNYIEFADGTHQATAAVTASGFVTLDTTQNINSEKTFQQKAYFDSQQTNGAIIAQQTVVPNNYLVLLGGQGDGAYNPSTAPLDSVIFTEGSLNVTSHSAINVGLRVTADSVTLGAGGAGDLATSYIQINNGATAVSTGPIPAVGDSSTKIATTEWVHTELTDYVTTSTPQTISGAKTFGDNTNFEASVLINYPTITGQNANGFNLASNGAVKTITISPNNVTSLAIDTGDVRNYTTMPAYGNSETIVPTTAWVQGAISNGISGSTTNISGGGAGQIPYNTGTNLTSFTNAGWSGQLLTSQGTGMPIWTDPTSGPVSTFVYTCANLNTSTTTNVVVPSNFRAVKFLIIGGGGGGGRGAYSYEHGNSGGAGGFAQTISFPLTAGASYTFAIVAGGGGSGGNSAPQSGSNGFASSVSYSNNIVGTLIAYGGEGGYSGGGGGVGGSTSPLGAFQFLREKIGNNGNTDPANYAASNQAVFGNYGRSGVGRYGDMGAAQPGNTGAVIMICS